MQCLLCSAWWVFAVVCLEVLQCHVWKRRPKEEPTMQQPTSSQWWEALPGVRLRDTTLSKEVVSRYASMGV